MWQRLMSSSSEGKVIENGRTCFSWPLIIIDTPPPPFPRSSSRSPPWTPPSGWWCWRSPCPSSCWTSCWSTWPGTTWTSVNSWRSPAAKAALCPHAPRASPGPSWPSPCPWCCGSTAPTLTCPPCCGPDWLQYTPLPVHQCEVDINTNTSNTVT